MKAPDKIYVREYPDGVARFWEERKRDDVVATIPHEYIRKDALIKKISELRTIPHDNTIARDNAFVEIINIINSIK